MPTFQFTSPEGKSFSVEGPDGATPEQAFGILQQHLGAAAQPSAPQPDKYAQAAQSDYSKMKAAGYEPGYARRVMQGATFGGGDEIMAGLNTPFQMAAHGTLNPIEGYKYAKALENAQMEDARNTQGALGTAAEIGGSLGSAGGIGKAGFTLAKDGVGLSSRALRMAGEGAAYGGVQGLLDGGDSPNDRVGGAAKGAALGGVLGGAMPVVAAAGKAAAAPLISNIRARVNPEGVAVSQIARGIGDSGKSVADVVNDVSGAATEGQPMYTVADAMGFPGQRLLRMGVDAPGPGRTNAVNFLEQRQAGQGRRVANTLTEGFDAPRTAEQEAERIVTAGRQVNAPAYQAAYEAGDKPIWSPTLERLSSSPTVQGAMRGAQRKWADWQIIDGYGSMNPPANVENGILKFGSGGLKTYPNLQYWDYTARDLAGRAQAARVAGNMQEAARYGNLEKLIKDELDKIVPEFKATRAGARGFFNQADAIDAGKAAALRGRTENTIPEFRGLSPQEKASYRIGYADPLIEQAQGGAFGVNKARPLTSDAFNSEAQAIAPLSSGNQMVRRLGREQTMFQTRAEATGGSKTSMNLADQEAQGIDPALLADIGHAGTGSPGAMMRLYSRITDSLNGYTPQVREQLVNLLLQRGQNPQIGAKIQNGLDRLRRNQAISSALMRGLTVGTATALPQRTTR